jgi:glutamate-1-semialdehyde 2,1-aminomutase
VTNDRYARSRQRMAEASSYLPGGVSSEFRKGVSPTPLVVARSYGAYVYDIDGNELIDYYLGMGPIILGHDPASVTSAVRKQLDNGILFAAQSELEFEAARLVCEMVPCAERVRFASSGSEVAQSAIRLARAATGRRRIIKFEGHYHGWFDNIYWSVAPSREHLTSDASFAPVPGSDGQDPDAARQVTILPWNNLEAVIQCLRSGEIAALIMEPVMCNAGGILPLPGYLEGVRRACDETGTVLIFDEVITGFRVAAGGAQARLGVTPDLAIFGKAISNGFPVAAIAGRAKLMDMFGVTAHVVHAGTYNSQALGMAATVATLKALKSDDAFGRLEELGTRLMQGMDTVLDSSGEVYCIQGWPQVFNVSLGTSGPITDYRSSLAADRARYVQLAIALLDRGVRALERGTWFLSLAHDDSVIDRTLEVFGEALAAVQLGHAGDRI